MGVYLSTTRPGYNQGYNLEPAKTEWQYNENVYLSTPRPGYTPGLQPGTGKI